MRKIKFRIFAVLTMLLFSATASFAQAVYYDEKEGGVVIDCTMMPTGRVLTKSMTDPNDDNQLIAHGPTDEANAVYPKLVVSLENIASDSWSNVVDATKDYTSASNHTDWRLPNQRELMLIWVLRKEIAAATNSFNSFESDAYWSSTTYNSNYYFVRFHLYVNNYDAGFTYFSSYTTTSMYARPVREIPL